MTLIAVIDDAGCMTFHKRRQSSDRNLLARIIEIAKSNIVWMDSYTAAQFHRPFEYNFRVSDLWPELVKDRDYVFMERPNARLKENMVDQVILFHWNRRYPGEEKFPLELKAPDWEKRKTDTFPGYSHKWITEEVWERV